MGIQANATVDGFDLSLYIQLTRILLEPDDITIARFEGFASRDIARAGGTVPTWLQEITLDIPADTTFADLKPVAYDLFKSGDHGLTNVEDVSED